MQAGEQQNGGFHRVLSRFKDNLSDRYKSEFQSVNISDVYNALDLIQRQQEKKGTLRNLRRLRPFLDAIDQLSKVLDIFINSSEFISYIWV
jgi:hypothetical protein